MKRIFALFVLMLFMQLLFAQSYQISTIRIEGNRTFSDEDVLELIELEDTDFPMDIDDAELKELQRQLLQTGYFQTYDLSVDKDALLFSLKEYPAAGEISIEGNKIIKEKKIRKKVKKVLKNSKGLYSYQIRQKILHEIRTFYQKKGLYETDITIEEEESASGKTVQLKVIVDEKNVQKIRKIRFSGNDSLSNRKLRKSMISKKSWIFKTHYYYPEVFKYDTERLSSIYRNMGFLDVEITSDTTSGEKGVELSINVVEGTRYQTGSLEIFGNTLFTDKEIDQQLKQTSEKYFNLELWTKVDSSRLFETYANEGIINTQVINTFEKSGDQVELTVKITEGDRFEVGNVEFIRPPLPDVDELNFFEKLGMIISPPVEEKVLRQIFDIQEGDVYKKHKIERGLFRLDNSRLFESVVAQGTPTEYQVENVPFLNSTRPGALGNPSKTKEKTNDIRVDLKEKSTGNLILSAGFGEDVGGFGQITYRELNVAGKFHQLDAVATLGSEYNSFNLSYFIPYFMGNKHTLLTKIYKNTYDRSEYDEDRIGFEIAYGTKYNDYITYSIGLKAVRVGLDIDDDLIPPYKGGIDISNAMYRHIDREFDSYGTQGLSFSITEDTRNNYKFPTKGYYQKYWLDAMGVFGGEFLPTVGADIKWFKEIGKGFVFATNSRFDWVIQDIDDIPLPERQYIGGTSSVRGFSYRRAGHVDALEDDLALGGVSRFVLRNEIRKKFSKMFTGALFLDAGVLGIDGPLDFDDGIKAGTGIRFIFSLPIGDVSLDVAQAINDDSEDETQTVHFNIGFAF